MSGYYAYFIATMTT